MIVIDASIALAWTYADERTDAVMQIFDRVSRLGAVAPVIWPMEIANSFAMSVRKNRITPSQRDILIASFMALGVEIQHHPTTAYWLEVLQLADKHLLTIYDASYLELAIRQQLPLATLDNDLRRGALAEGVTVLP